MRVSCQSWKSAKNWTKIQYHDFEKRTLIYKGFSIFCPIFLYIYMKVVLRNTKKLSELIFLNFLLFWTISGWKTPKIGHFLWFWQIWHTINGKKNQKSTPTTFLVFIRSTFMQIFFGIGHKMKKPLYSNHFFLVKKSLAKTL